MECRFDDATTHGTSQDVTGFNCCISLASQQRWGRQNTGAASRRRHPSFVEDCTPADSVRTTRTWLSRLVSKVMGNDGIHKYVPHKVYPLLKVRSCLLLFRFVLTSMKGTMDPEGSGCNSSSKSVSSLHTSHFRLDHPAPCSFLLICSPSITSLNMPLCRNTCPIYWRFLDFIEFTMALTSSTSCWKSPF